MVNIMSRQRSYTNGFNHRLRSDKPFYQASDSEIKADLKKLDYLNPPKKDSYLRVKLLSHFLKISLKN